MKKLIKVRDHFYIINNSEIKENDYRLEKESFLDGTVKTLHKYKSLNWKVFKTDKCDLPYTQRAQRGKNAANGICGCYKISHSTLILPGIKSLDLDYVEKIVYGYNIEEIIQSLLPKTEWDIEIDQNNKIKLL